MGSLLTTPRKHVTERDNRNDRAAETQLRVLMHEYDALYGLASLRMASLDRRAPIAGAALTGFLAAAVLLPRPAQLALLVTLPVALLWFLRTTINHARSFEDVLRRIEEIERHANRLAGGELLVFQSRHPSRGKSVGGRTGRETIRSVFCICVVLLGLSGYLAAAQAQIEPRALMLYAAYLVAVLGHLLATVVRLRLYRYEKQE